MATPLDMQPVVDAQVESPKSKILEKTGEACKRLSIAVATATALHCSPAFAQSAVSPADYAIATAAKGSGVLTIDGKNVSFTEFLTKYPNEQERDDILGKMDRATKNAFRKWEVSMESGKIDNKKGALNQITQVNAILDELMQNQGLKLSSETQKKVNQEKGSIILAALDNPTITQGMKPETISILRTIGNSLQKGGNLAYMNNELIKNIKIAL